MTTAILIRAFDAVPRYRTSGAPIGAEGLAAFTAAFIALRDARVAELRSAGKTPWIACTLEGVLSTPFDGDYQILRGDEVVVEENRLERIQPSRYGDQPPSGWRGDFEYEPA